MVPPFKVDIYLFAKASKDNHIASIDPNGRGQVARSPGRRLGMSGGHRSLHPDETALVPASPPTPTRVRCLSPPKLPSGKDDSKPRKGYRLGRRNSAIH